MLWVSSLNPSGVVCVFVIADAVALSEEARLAERQRRAREGQS